MIFLSERKASLPLSRAANASANCRGAFFGARAGDVAVFDGGDLDVEIDAIEQRSGDALAITLDLAWTAAPFALQVAEVPTRHGRMAHEHELRVGNMALSAAAREW